MKPETFQRAFLLLLVVAISIVFLWMIRYFLMPLLLAALFSSLARPLYLRLLSLTGGREKTSSGLALLILVLLIILPLFGFLVIFANQALSVTENVRPWIQEKLVNKEEFHRNLQHLPGSAIFAPYSEQIVSHVGAAISGLGNYIFQRASAFTTGTIIFFINVAVMLYAMFFFFIDGVAILRKILFYMPLHNRDEKRLLDGFRSMARATIKSLVIIGAVQGTLAGLAFWATGIPSALFWGTVMAVFSMIPNIGSALVWVPGCLFLVFKGDTTTGVLLFLWCALVVGTVDNFLRPILVGKDTKVPELLILVSTLGGLTMLGLSGFVMGPALALFFLTIWDIYGITFKDVLPKTGDLHSPKP